MPRVHFVKQGKVVEVSEGANLRQVALDNDIDLYPFPHNMLGNNLNCHGFGLCGTCRVKLDDPSGVSEPTKFDWYHLGTEDPSLRLACKCEIKGDLDVVTTPRHLSWYDHPFYVGYKDDNTEKPGIPG